MTEALGSNATPQAFTWHCARTAVPSITVTNRRAITCGMGTTTAASTDGEI